MHLDGSGKVLKWIYKLRILTEDFHAVFIRAPLILSVGNEVDVICMHNQEIVAARQGHLLAASFHPELTDDERIHRYFLSMIREYKKETTSV